MKHENIIDTIGTADPSSLILTFNYDTGERYLSVDDLF